MGKQALPGKIRRQNRCKQHCRTLNANPLSCIGQKKEIRIFKEENGFLISIQII